MAKRTSRRKFTWFPVVGAAGPAETNDNFAQLIGVFGVPANGTTNTVISPVVTDVPMEGDAIDPNAPGQLVQALGQEYFLERIVGKCFLSASAPADDGATQFPKTILIGCSFFVARANDEDVGGGQNTPIGSASLPERVENYSPLSEDCIREPWIWRRTWILSTGRVPTNQNVFSPFTPTVNASLATITPGVFQDGAPTTNIHCGSGMDGPHFDSKSVRRVGNDERLWFVISVRTLDLALNVPGTPTNESFVALVLDYRVLGRLTRARGRSSF